MSEKCKKTKADLVALYNLKFYRKQSNWKLCSQVLKKDNNGIAQDKNKKFPAQSEVAEQVTCLNKTYNVEVEALEEADIHNQAFVDTDNDKYISSPQHSPKSTKDWYEGKSVSPQNSPKSPTRDWHDGKSQSNHQNAENFSEPIFQNWRTWKETQISLDTAQNTQQIWSGNVLQDDYQGEADYLPNMEEKVYAELENVWPNSLWPENLIDLPEIEKEGYEGNEAGWPLDTLWNNQKMSNDAIWSEDVLRELELLNAYALEPEDSAPADKWVPAERLLQWMLANKECMEDVLESSCESEQQFMRAAHCVPHSSEVDLRAHEASLEELVAGSGEPVGALSESALRSAGRAHARALRRVAAELRVRERIKEERDLRSRSTGHPSPPRYDISCEEYPTRDIGLYQPSFMDTFISGSYKNNPNVKDLDILNQQDREWERNIADSDQMGLHQGHEGWKLRLEKGQIVVEHIGPMRDQMGPQGGQLGLDEGRMGLESGQLGLNRDRMGLESGQLGLNRDRMGLESGQLGLNRDRMGLESGQLGLNRGQTGLDRGEPGCFGEYCLIGRGRGRLPFNENKIGVGRGRGRT